MHTIVMAIICHQDQPWSRGYYSKILGRKIVTSAIGAQTFELWEQIIPPGGYIVPHYHPCEESITFLSGCVAVTLAEETVRVEVGSTLFVPAGVIHHIRNDGQEDVRLLAFLAASQPEVIYPGEKPLPIDWDSELFPG